MKSSKSNFLSSLILPLFFLLPAHFVQATTFENPIPSNYFSDSLSAKRKLSEEVLLAMDTPKNLEVIVERTVDGQIEASPSLRPFRKELDSFFKKIIGWESLKQHLVGIYTQSFSISELKDLLAFFKSPTGKRYSAIAPEFSGMINEISMQKIAQNSAELQSIFTKSKTLNQK